MTQFADGTSRREFRPVSRLLLRVARQAKIEVDEENDQAEPGRWASDMIVDGGTTFGYQYISSDISADQMSEWYEGMFPTYHHANSSQFTDMVQAKLDGDTAEARRIVNTPPDVPENTALVGAGILKCLKRDFWGFCQSPIGQKCVLPTRGYKPDGGLGVQYRSTGDGVPVTDLEIPARDLATLGLTVEVDSHDGFATGFPTKMGLVSALAALSTLRRSYLLWINRRKARLYRLQKDPRTNKIVIECQEYLWCNGEDTVNVGAKLIFEDLIRATMDVLILQENFCCTESMRLLGDGYRQTGGTIHPTGIAGRKSVHFYDAQHAVDPFADLCSHVGTTATLDSWCSDAYPGPY